MKKLLTENCKLELRVRLSHRIQMEQQEHALALEKTEPENEAVRHVSRRRSIVIAAMKEGG